MRRFVFQYFFLLLFSIFLIGCGGSDESSNLNKPSKPVVILVFGDSISQGYGTSIIGQKFQHITPGNTYTELLRKHLIAEKYDEFTTIIVVNESLGGEYTDEALFRISSVLKRHKPTHVLLAHGTNDAVSRVSNTIIARNFEAMISKVRANNAIPFIVDIRPILYGITFGEKYSQSLLALSKKTNAPIIDLTFGIYNKSQYYRDEFHFNDSAQNIMMNNVLNVLIGVFE